MIPCCSVLEVGVKSRAFVWKSLEVKEREWKQELIEMFHMNEAYQKYWDKVCYVIWIVCFCRFAFLGSSLTSKRPNRIRNSNKHVKANTECHRLLE